MFTFLLVVHAIIAAALVGVILMQRSEGGGLGVGGSPSGLMSARGAADFLTRATTILATLFVLMCIVLAALASLRGTGTELDSSLVREQAATGQPLVAPENTVAPATNDPLAVQTATTTRAVAPNAASATSAPAPKAQTKAGSTAPATSDPLAKAPADTPAAARVTPPVVTRTTPANASVPAATGNTTGPNP